MLQSCYLKLSSPLVQYLIAVALGILWIFLLLSDDPTKSNLWLPEGEHAHNLWKGKDVLTYVGPARNFLEHHVFGSGATPDYHRTIGYPMFLSALMMLFGDNWLLAAFFVQALLFACIFPVLCQIARLLFNSTTKIVTLSFIFLTLAGTYLVTVPVILTDLFFTVFLTIGLYLSSASRHSE